MKEVFATFAIGVLCFVAFVTTVKPTAINAVQSTNKPANRVVQSMRMWLAGPYRSLRRHRRMVTVRRCHD